MPLVEALGQSGPAPQPIERWAQQNEDFGVNVPVIEIRGWDQVSRNDPSVTVSVVIAGGVEGGGARWNGTDRMIPYEDSIGAMGEIAVRDDAAYIIDGLLVARVPRNFFPISLGDELPSFKVSFTDGYLLAEIGEGILGLDRIVFTGRWREADLVSALARVGECIPGGDTLPPGLLSPTQYLDLATTPTGDGVPGVSCGALSAAIMFRRGTPIDEILLERPIAFADGCE